MNAAAKPADVWSAAVGHLSLQKPLMVQESTTVKETIEAMQARKTGCALVVDGEKRLVGIFTERDVMKKYVGTPVPPRERIAAVMTRDPMTLPPATTVSRALDCFGEKHFRHLPVCGESGRVKGLLSVRVLTDYIAEHLPGDVLNLPPDSGIVSQKPHGG